MNSPLSIKAVGHSTSLFLLITISICIIFDVIFPEYAMYEAWQKLLPGFEWGNRASVFLGMIWTYLYGWYFALVWVPLYNAFSKRN